MCHDLSTVPLSHCKRSRNCSHLTLSFLPMTMSTLSIAALEARLENLDVHSPLPKFANTQVLQNPIDIYRSYLTNILVPLVSVEPQVVYGSLQWANNLGHGDLLLVFPKLRLKGVKPVEYAKVLASKVYRNSLSPICNCSLLVS
jgi:arginyl-tRNA synthetase